MSNFIAQIAKIKLAFVSYALVLVGLFLYSFTQVDLSLTLSRLSIWQTIQKSFQYIGYFQRPLSTELFLALLLFLFAFYLYFLSAANKKKINQTMAWGLVLAVAVILALSYNAFSYDLFNYVFDAKIITHYHQNPYLHKALDYPGDPMLSFMHWTHRVYPYGPTWLAVTVPLSFIGSKIFLFTLILFKLLATICFVGSAYFIGKILRRIAPDREIFGILFFALNPLVIIEGVVSAHNDIVMVFFALWAIYLLLEKKYAWSLLLLLFSVGIKFVTLILFPFFVMAALIQRKKIDTSWSMLFTTMALSMIAGVVVATVRTNFQPWYLLFFLPFAALVPKKAFLIIPSIVISLFSLLQYVPFLYLGNWDPPVPYILSLLLYGSVVISLCIILMWYVFGKLRQKTHKAL